MLEEGYVGETKVGLGMAGPLCIPESLRKVMRDPPGDEESALKE